MKAIAILVSSLFFVTVLSSSAMGVQKRLSVTDKEILESLHSLDVRLARVEERIAKVEERITKLEERITRLEERIAKLEVGQAGLQKQIDDLRGLMLAGFAMILAGIIGLIGVILWDRRTALAPAVKEIEYLKQRGQKWEEAWRRYAATEPKMAEIMRSLGLL